MNRLTVNLKKQYDDHCLSLPCYQGEENAKNYVSPYKENFYLPNKNVAKQDCYNKLGNYEDSENNLGCPIDVLIRALKDGIWTHFDYDFEGEPIGDLLNKTSLRLEYDKNLGWELTYIYGCSCRNDLPMQLDREVFRLREYKITWWLKQDKSE